MKVNKKALILKSAQKSFFEFGYAKTTLDDIAYRMGMKKSSLYYYYDSKDVIFAEVLELESKNLKTILETEIEKHSEAKEQLKAFALSRNDYFNNQINLKNIENEIVLEIRPIIEEKFHSFKDNQIAILECIIKNGVVSGEFTAGNYSKKANQVFTILESLNLVHILKNKGINEHELEDILDIIIKGLTH